MKKIIILVLALSLGAMVKSSDFSQLRLNEISGVDAVLFVEIFNAGTEQINLEGVRLQRNEGPTHSTSLTTGTEWVGQAGDVIPAGAYRIILFRNGRGDGNNSGPHAPSQLQENPAWPGMSWTVTGGLSNQQILKIALVDPSGNPIDVFIRGDEPLPGWGTAGASRPGNMNSGAYGNIRPSYSRMADGSWAWAIVTPGTTNGQRVQSIANPGYLTAMPAPELDPIVAGEKDSLFEQLLILQAYGSSANAAGASHSFVELFNNSNTPIRLSGITLFYAAGLRDADATEDVNWQTIALRGTIAPGHSFLILGQRQNLRDGWEPDGVNNTDQNPRYVIPANSGDMNVANFVLNDSTFKVALIRASTNSKLTVQNPLTMDNDEGLSAEGLIDFRTGGIGSDTFEIVRPRNRAFGQWDLLTGERFGARASGTLPVVFIDTEDGLPIVSKAVWRRMAFRLEDPNNSENNIEELVNQEIRGRGNSTWNYGLADGNPPYRVRFRSGQEQSLFGLPAARNWVLLVGHRWGGDATAFELGRRLGLENSPTTNFVELVFNGEFKGLRQLSEHRQADPLNVGAPGRPRIAENGGWFVEIDRGFDVSSDYGDPGFRTANFDLPVLIKAPDFPEFPNNGIIPESVDNFVRNDWNRLTDLMAAYNFPENEWRDLIYMDSWVRYFMVNAVTRNSYYSVYSIWNYSVQIGHTAGKFVYKNVNNRIAAGPLWDLDNNLRYLEIHTGERIYTARREPWLNVHWVNQFFLDPIFVVRWKEIWNEKFGAISSMPEFLDSVATRIAIHVSGPHRVGLNNRVQFLEERIPFLDSVYNTVSILPSDSPDDFSSASHNFTSLDLQITPQTFTLVAYGEMMGLEAFLKNADTSAFEIISELTQTPTGKGGYLATITITAKTSVSVGKTHKDTLILSGTNQDNPFSFRVPLELATPSITLDDIIALHDSINSLNQTLTTCEENLVEAQEIIIEWIEITYDLLDTIDWLRQLLIDATNVVETGRAQSLQVFPNPATNVLHIVHDWQSGDVVELFDMNGRRVFAQPVEIGHAPSLHNGTFVIDMSQFPTGNYILRIGNRVAKIVRR